MKILANLSISIGKDSLPQFKILSIISVNLNKGILSFSPAAVLLKSFLRLPVC